MLDPPHRYTVKLFGPQAQLAGTEVLHLDLPDPAATEAELLQRLGEACPAVSPSLAASRLAINFAYPGPDDTAAPGDEIALIGMVSGG